MYLVWEHGLERSYSWEDGAKGKEGWRRLYEHLPTSGHLTDGICTSSLLVFRMTLTVATSKTVQDIA